MPAKRPNALGAVWQVQSPVRLGALEAAVLRHLWAHQGVTVKAVHCALGIRRGIAHNTVQSTMVRLHRKALLTREKVGHAFVYSPAITRGELAVRLMKQAAQQVHGGRGVMFAALVDLAEEAGDAALAELESLVAQRRRPDSGA